MRDNCPFVGVFAGGELVSTPVNGPADGRSSRGQQ